MSNSVRYNVSQLLALPLVALPSLLTAVLVWTLIGSQISMGPVWLRDLLSGAGSLFAGYAASLLLGRIVAWVLIRMDMLPRRALHRYPQGFSWSDDDRY